MADKNEKKAAKKKAANNTQLRVYSLEELADLFGISIQRMDSMYKIRGIKKDEKLSYDEAFEKFKNIA